MISTMILNLAGAKLRVKPRPELRAGIAGRLKAVSVLSMREPQFAGFIQELESDPLFERLFLPGGSLPRVIRRNPWPGTRWHGGFHELREDAVSGAWLPPVESFLEGRGQLVETIRRLGREAFEKYFLYGDAARSVPEIASRTGLAAPEVRKINAFLLEVSVQSEFFHAGAQDCANKVHYTLIAHIQVDPYPGTPCGKVSPLIFAMASPHLARGRYQVDREALEEWKRQMRPPPEQKRRLRMLLEKIELANLRHNTLLRILEAVAESQGDYLRSRRESRRRPLSMRSLAGRLGLSPSTVSRAAACRSVRLPWGEEIPLSGLFSSRRTVLAAILVEIFRTPSNRELSDSALAGRIRREYGVGVSRRALNEIRRICERQNPCSPPSGGARLENFSG